MADSLKKRFRFRLERRTPTAIAIQIEERGEPWRGLLGIYDVEPLTRPMLHDLLRAMRQELARRIFMADAAPLMHGFDPVEHARS